MKRWLLGLLSVLMLITSAAFAEDLGKTTVELDGRSAHIQVQETNLGNFVADAIRNAAKADIAVVQATAFRDKVLPAGTVSDQSVRDALTSPTSKIVVLTLTPAVVQKMVERSFSKAPNANTAFLQISGMTINYDSANAQGALDIKVGDKALSAYDAAATITVAMPRELGTGGSGYIRVFPEDVITAMTTTETTIYDAIKAEFTRQKGTVTPKIEARIVDKSAK